MASKLADMISRKEDTDYIDNININLAYEMAAKKLSVKELANRSGIKEGTLYMRMKNPGTFRQSEIVEIARVLKISPYILVSSKLHYTENLT